MTLDGV